MTFRDEIVKAARASHRPLEAAVVEACARHFDLLLRWNQTHNLTRIVAPAEAARKHYLDCLVPLLDARDAGLVPASFVDVGSGAGFPGLLACVAWPTARATLVEPAQKRASFLLLAAQTMGLKVSVVSSVDATPLALARVAVADVGNEGSAEAGRASAGFAGGTTGSVGSDAGGSGGSSSNGGGGAGAGAGSGSSEGLLDVSAVVLSRATFSPGRREELVRAAGDAIAVWGHAHDVATWSAEVATWGGWRTTEQVYAVDGLEPRSLLWAMRGVFHVKHPAMKP